MVSRKVSRRRFVAGTAAASTALVAAPFVRGAHAAGKLSLGLWDHWVPGANKATEEVIKAWADKEKVEAALNGMVPAGDRGLLSLRLILHGRRVCAARRPRCEACVLNDFCPSSLV